MNLKSVITENVMRHKRHLMHIMCGDGSFAYSIGNHTRNLPELLVLGNWPFDITAATLNLLSEKFEAEGEQLGVIDIGFTMPVKVREASAKAKEDYTFQATYWLNSQDYRVLQVMLPDKNGKYPDEEGCLTPFNVRIV